MKVITFNPPSNHSDWNTITSAYIGTRGVFAEALAYYSRDDIPSKLVQQTNPQMGILTVITGNGTPSKQLQIEMREADMADFCRSYLEAYDARKHL